MPTPGPLRVLGYPKPLAAGMSDPADQFGFTRDGESVVTCQYDICCASNHSECRLTNREGRETVRSTMTTSPPEPGVIFATKSSLRAFAKEENLEGVGPPREMMRLPPPPSGTFAYGGDFVLTVAEIAPTTDKNGFVVVPGRVKIGAQLPGEEAVWVFHPLPPPPCEPLPEICMEAQLNGLSVSPNGQELAAFVYTRLPSHGSIVRATRMAVATFASLVFNDTGMAHHRKGAWRKAAELFTRAVYADPSRELPAYNLACALARAGDARAEQALAHALERGGTAVRERAAKDKDFDSVRTTPWFRAAVGGR